MGVNDMEKTGLNRRNRGSITLIVLLVLVLVSLIGIIAITASYYNSKLAGNEIRRKRAFYIAEQGAMAAIETLNVVDSLHGVIFSDYAVAGGSYTVEVFDSTDYPWLGELERIVKSIGKHGNAVRRLEYRLVPTTLGYNNIPGPLYIEAPNPQFSGNVFTVQGSDHHYGDPNYYIPTPPGDPKPAVGTIQDSASLAAAIGMHGDQIFTCDDTGAVIEDAFVFDQDTFDLQALADIYAGPNGEFADTINYIAGMYPNDYKVSYFPGDCMVSGGGHTGGGGAQITCPNCGGTGVISCYGCNGSGYELQGTGCPFCGGTGVVTCSFCGGVGHFTCPDCGGTGGNPVACDSCEGTGIYGCKECGGTGICPICHGTGYWKESGPNKWSCYRCGTGGKNDPPGTGICPTCGGTGGIPCPFCGGTGIDTTTWCSTCGGTGVIPCDSCGGTGVVICDSCGGTGGTGARICHVCGGSGTITCPYCNGLGTIPEEGCGAGPAGTIGAGVLVVCGDLHISGQFEFVGLVIVLGEVSTDITGGGQGCHIWGALLSRTVDFKISGNSDICWCSDALKRLKPRMAGYQVASVIEY
ncbi:hypothetical protein DRQ36_09310 [bacterium]|nr:MAG: hypothetical protein DRQ36_09310 [bacterium]